MFDPRMMPTARLAFVVRKLPGTVEREKVKWVPNRGGKGGTLVRTKVAVDAGYMVYFPKGHAIRLTESQLAHYGLSPNSGVFVSMEGLVPMDKTVQIENQRIMGAGFEALEAMTIRLATKRTGPVLMPEQLQRVPLPTAASAEA